MPTCDKDTYFKDGYVYVFGTKVLLPSGVWRFNKQSKLVNYNVNYFDFIHSSKSCYDKGEEIIQLLTWIDGNNDFSAISWHAYPTSLRIINWVKFLHGLQNVHIGILKSLEFQGHWLINNLEYQLLGNHLFVNAKALIFCGYYLSGNDAEKIKNLGIEILIKELKEQVLDDGASFELSPMYHGIMLEDLLDLFNFISTYTDDANAPRLLTHLELVILKMFRWLGHMTPPTGRYAHFNDSSGGVAPSYIKLIEYAERIGIVVPIIDGVSIYFENSSYACIKNRDALLICDAAKVGPDYIPGHAHADTLSFEFFLNNKEVFVNSGTSEYGLSNERLRQRSTSAHNTAVIDDADSSEVWGGFRVAKRAVVTDVLFDMNTNYFTATHDGYMRLPCKAIHKREWQLNEKELIITDTINSFSPCEVETYFYIHPDIIISQITNNSISMRDNNNVKIVEIKFNENVSIFIEATTYHPQFGKSIPNNRLRFKSQISNSINMKYIISWN